MNPEDTDPLPPDVAGEAPAAGGVDASPKPKRRRAPRKTAAAAGEAGSGASDSDEARVVRAPEAAEVFGEPGRSAAPAAALAPAADGEAAGPAGAPDGAGTSEDGPRSRRNRNRRRGRRGGERRNEAGAAEAPAVTPPAIAEAAAATAPQTQALFEQLLSGDFDAEPTEVLEPSGPAATEAVPVAPGAAVAGVDVDIDIDTAAPTHEGAVDGTDVDPAQARRVLAPEPDAPKLHKVLAQAGVGSRRDLEQMIADGRVAVNGEAAHTGQRISFGDRITIDGKPVRFRIAPPPARVLAYHKPAGEVVTHDDPQQRPTVFRRLPRLQQGKWQSVGRLDINTEGLLLFTNSGELANQLMHPRFGVEREYAVRSLGELGVDAKARLLEGVEIDGQRCAFKSIEDGGGEGANHWYRCVITEGRNREVRRLFEACGHAVSRLIRIRYGSVVLPRGLKRGVWVDLQDGDLRALRRLTGVQPRAERAPEVEGQGPREPQQPQPPQQPRDAREGRDGRAKRNNNRRGGRGNGNGNPNLNGNGHARDGAPAGEFRPDRPPRAERPPRQDRIEPGNRAERPHPLDRPGHDEANVGPIPNPLQQTFDKRAIQQARALRRDMPEDGPIPNPLQQTYDKRALQRDRAPQRDIPEDGPIPNPLQQTYDRRFANGPGPGGGGNGNNASRQGARGRGGKKPAGDPNRVPDPMQTSVGFIGADAFHRKGGKRGGAGAAGGGGGNRGGQRGGGGAGGSGGGPRGNNRGGPRGGSQGGGRGGPGR